MLVALLSAPNVYSLFCDEVNGNWRIWSATLTNNQHFQCKNKLVFSRKFTESENSAYQCRSNIVAIQCYTCPNNLTKMSEQKTISLKHYHVLLHFFLTLIKCYYVHKIFRLKQQFKLSNITIINFMLKKRLIFIIFNSVSSKQRRTLLL